MDTSTADTASGSGGGTATQQVAATSASPIKQSPMQAASIAANSQIGAVVLQPTAAQQQQFLQQMVHVPFHVSIGLVALFIVAFSQPSTTHRSARRRCRA